MPVMFQKYSVASSKVVFIREPGALILILVNALSLSVAHYGILSLLY